MTPRRTLVVLALSLAAATAHADDKGFSIGLQGHARTEPADVGLPVFGGAVPYAESEGDKPAVTLGAWAGKFGLRLDALKFRSSASPERVAAFYARAMARYGEVLDCRDPAARVKPPKDSDKLSCETAEPKAGDYEYRVGTAKAFRVVSVKRDGEGTRFDLARIELNY
ncbi:MAG: hypothetical protein EKK53_27810 [Burkholderiales bacterium]|nr:MAG: hypothetical protein EKK53_27810 [Burkholderiales bacterium]